jgi:hypothetical protein
MIPFADSEGDTKQFAKGVCLTTECIALERPAASVGTIVVVLIVANVLVWADTVAYYFSCMNRSNVYRGGFREGRSGRSPPLKGPKFKFFYYFYRLSHRYKRIIVLSNNIITN